MKSKNLVKSLSKMLTILVGLALISTTGCKKDDDDDNTTPSNVVNFTLTTLTDGTIQVEGSTNQTYTFDDTKKYLLKGFVYVEEGGVLNVDAGTVITGDKASKGTLIVKRGGKINAIGTAADPIVFTSAEDIGSRNPGDWGGIIICGKAPINLAGGEGQIEGGPDALYGGTDAADNSGTLKYVRIEYAGIPFQPNQEINGLTLGGVGSATTIDYIQVSYCGDDSYEMFGGTVNLKHIISYKTTDDDLDTDNGFIGKIQFGVVLRDGNIADVSGSNGFESDNDANGSTLTPNTKAIFSNISIFGPKSDTSTSVNSNFKRGAHLRRNTQTSIYNSLISGYPVGLLVDGSACEGNATGDALQVRNTIIATCNTPLAVASGSSFNINAWFTTPSYGNSIQFDNNGLATAPYASTPNFLPAGGSILLSGADFTNTNLSGMEVVTFRGAFGTTDWTSGWANWDPQNTAY
jgi:hypothetical protein